MADTPTTKVITGKVRLSYAHIWEPSKAEGSEELKYSAALIIPKSDTVTIGKINKIVEALKADIKTKKGGKLPAKLKLPLRDGDEEKGDDPTYKDSYFINVSSKTKPGVVDKNLNEIIDKEEVYSGCYAKVSINFFSFDKAGSIGISAGLNNIMKVADGEQLSGRASAADDFADENTDVDLQEDITPAAGEDDDWG